MRRRELGVLLRALRTEHGWTVDQVAQRLLVSPSKVSRLETGQRGASPRDIRDLCDLYDVDEALRLQLTELAAEGKQHALARGLPYATYVGLESEATAISDFGLGVVPGLLQTAGYARAVLRAMRPGHSDDAIELRVKGRLDRQRRLSAEDAPRFHALIDEGLLHRVAGSPETMRAQLDHLVAASRQPNIAIQVLPFAAGVLPVTNNKFIILEFSKPFVSELVYIEGMHGDVYLDRPDEVETYKSSFRAMREMAATEEETRMLVESISARLE